MKLFTAVSLALVSARVCANSCLPVEQLFARDAHYEEATRVGDAAFLNDLLADDFVWVHNQASAIEDKSLIIKRAQKPTEIPKARTTSDLHAQVLDNTVVLRGLSSVDKWNPDGKTWRTSRYQFMRTYVSTAKGCKLLAVQTMKVWSSDGK